MTFEDLDDDLRALGVHDISAERAERTRARCLDVLAARRRRAGARSGVASRYGWLEPVAALGASALYLAAAMRAATVLMLLP